MTDDEDFLNTGVGLLRTAEQKRAVRWAQEQIAAAVEQSAFYYAGTGATKVVPSASGEMTTHVMAAYIRSLDLDERRLTGRNTDHEQATTRDGPVCPGYNPVPGDARMWNEIWEFMHDNEERRVDTLVHDGKRIRMTRNSDGSITLDKLIA